jgi:hypothetical protein
VFYQAGGNPNSIAVGDFNRDKKLDLAVADTTESTVSLLLGKWGRHFSSEEKSASFRFFRGRSVRLISMGDGNLDLAVSTPGNGSDNTVNVLFGDGRGNFASPMIFITGTDSHTVAVGDVDVNASPDLAVTIALDDTVIILLNRHKP